MRLVVGLGNPGRKYAGNRHNIGFMAADALVRRHDFPAWRSRFRGQVSEGEIAGEPVLVLKPQTYMNESGRAVGEAVRFFKLAPESVIVVYDELDLALGRLRVKHDGGNGGHNGLRSIDAHIGRNYWRLRLGIGHPGDKAKVTGHVLSDFGRGERETVDRLLDSAAARFELILADRASDFMSKVAMDLAPEEGTASGGGKKGAVGKGPAKKTAAKKAAGRSPAERLLAERRSGEAAQDAGATEGGAGGDGDGDTKAGDGDGAPGGLAGQLRRLFNKDK